MSLNDGPQPKQNRNPVNQKAIKKKVSLGPTLQKTNNTEKTKLRSTGHGGSLFCLISAKRFRYPCSKQPS